MITYQNLLLLVCTALDGQLYALLLLHHFHNKLHTDRNRSKLNTCTGDLENFLLNMHHSWHLQTNKIALRQQQMHLFFMREICCYCLSITTKSQPRLTCAANTRFKCLNASLKDTILPKLGSWILEAHSSTWKINRLSSKSSLAASSYRHLYLVASTSILTVQSGIVPF